MFHVNVIFCVVISKLKLTEPPPKAALIKFSVTVIKSFAGGVPKVEITYWPSGIVTVTSPRVVVNLNILFWLLPYDSPLTL